MLGSDILEKTSNPVEVSSDETRRLVEDLFDTLETCPGIGLAGPQIGVLKRVFVIKLDDGVRRAFVNPQITGTSPETVQYEEGCLSIPDVWCNVVRPVRVSVFAYDENGKPFNLDADGILARCIQHEYDHLEGRLFIDHTASEERERLVRRFEKKQLLRSKSRRGKRHGS